MRQKCNIRSSIRRQIYQHTDCQVLANGLPSTSLPTFEFPVGVDTPLQSDKPAVANTLEISPVCRSEKVRFPVLVI
jgi:hypothetical protein